MKVKIGNFESEIPNHWVGAIFCFLGALVMVFVYQGEYRLFLFGLILLGLVILVFGSSKSKSQKV